MSSVSPSYPFKFESPLATELFKTFPSRYDGLVIDPNVFDEFLDPPQDFPEWFLQKAYAQVMPMLDADRGVTEQEYQAIRVAFGNAAFAIRSWTQDRAAVTRTQGWGPISDAMLKSGTSYYRGIVTIETTAADLEEKNSTTHFSVPDPETIKAATNLCDVLWEYLGSQAVEIEASVQQVPAKAVLDSLNNARAHAWTPAITPKNLPDEKWKDVKISSGRLGFGDTAAPGQDDDPFSEDGDHSGSGDGGSGK